MNICFIDQNITIYVSSRSIFVVENIFLINEIINIIGFNNFNIDVISRYNIFLYPIDACLT